jgi:hypothetical protein
MTDEAEEPENQQNNENSPEHKVSFGLSFFCFVSGGEVALIVFSRASQFFDQFLSFLWKSYGLLSDIRVETTTAFPSFVLSRQISLLVADEFKVVRRFQPFPCNLSKASA